MKVKVFAPSLVVSAVALLFSLLLPGPPTALAAQQTAAAAAQAASVRPALTNDYRIGARDVLEISVFGVDQLNTSVRVAENGVISLPLVGNISAAGLTRSALEDEVEEALSRFVTEPQVSVFIREYESQRIAVIGAVHRPGTIEMVGRMTLLEAISDSGGVDMDASSGSVMILRSGTSGSPIEVDLDQLLRRGDTAMNIALEAGDTVNVLAKEVYFVYIYGRVRSPGSYDLRESITLLQAVSLAGGLADRAARDKIIVLRRRADGTQERIRVNLTEIIDGKRPDFPILPSDVIIVQETFF